jgi:hypothetical protein
MTAPRTDPLAEWAAILKVSQRRFRQAAKDEVPRTAVEAMLEVALAVTAGQHDRPSLRAYTSAGDEPGPQTIENPRRSGAPTPAAIPASLSRRPQASPLASAVAAPLRTRYSRFVGTRKPPLAFALGLALGLTLGRAIFGGLSAIVALLAACSAANDLLR